MDCRAIFFIIFLLLVMPLAHADVPRLISVQGRLTDDVGTLITAPTDFTFRIYDAPAPGGNLLWTEPWTGAGAITPDASGVFSVLLGSSSLLNIPFDIPYWLEVEINGETLTPRQQIGSAGYALGSAQWLSNGNDIYSANSGNVGIGTSSPAAKLDISGTMKATSYLGDGSLLTGISSGLWTQSGSDIYYDTGNVGIGTTSPTEKLTATGTIESTIGGFKLPDGTVIASAEDILSYVAGSCLIDNDGDGFPLCQDACDDNPAANLFGTVDADGDGHNAIGGCGGSSDDYCDGDPSAWLQMDTDVDGDGHSPVETCPGGVKPRDDCDDSCATCYPGSSSYTCSSDGKDQDCDGSVDEWDYGSWSIVSSNCGVLGQSCEDWLTNSGLFSGCVTPRAVKCTDTFGAACDLDWYGYGVGIGMCIYELGDGTMYIGNPYDDIHPLNQPTKCMSFFGMTCASGCTGLAYTHVRFAGSR